MHSSAAALDPADGKPICVLVLVPCAETADPSLDYYYDYSQSRQEFARAFAELRVDWRWEPVTSRNHRTVIDAFVRETSAQTPVVFNLCDGDESNDVPGISVIRYLDEQRLIYTGASEAFFGITTSKIHMKRAFGVAGVTTAPWDIVGRDTPESAHLFTKLGSPLIVKPAVSAGSMGITTQSVVDHDAALREQVRLLHDGYRGWDLASGGVFVERYIAGPEFTTFIVGSANDSGQCTVYPPVERVFHSSLPAVEQFLSYDRLWEVYERETPIGDGEYLWEYRPAPEELSARICDASLAAYAAVDGCGYGRVDLRMDTASGELHVLEVNAQCGLSEDENHTSIGAILRFANRSYSELVRQIITDAVARCSTARQCGPS